MARTYRFRAAATVFLVLSPTMLRAGTVYSITDLGVLPGGGTSAAAGLSSNGKVTGSADSASASSTPLLWAPTIGLSAVDVDSTFAFGTGVNASGAVVGYGYSSDFTSYQAFVNDGLTTTILPTLGGTNNAAYGINNAGAIVGSSETATGIEEGFVYASGTLLPLGTLPGGTTSRANAINNSNVVAGQADVGELLHAVIFVGSGTWIDIGVPLGYESSYATAISDAGQVAGTLDDGFSNAMAFVWQSGTMSILGSLTTGGYSQAYGVNSNGFVVGASDGAAFLYHSGGMDDLNTLLVSTSSAWQLTEANAINDLGQIAGTGYYDGEQHAYLLTPTPEPTSLPLLYGALLLLAAGKRRYFQTERR